jgi:hypothetical protein
MGIRCLLFVQSGAKSVSQQVASGGLLIANGQYEIVGDGKECKAVDMQTKTIFHCLVRLFSS